MATIDQIPTDLTLDLGGDLAPDEFLAAVKNFLGYVNEITDAQAGDGAEVTWTVKVREGSSLIGVAPGPSAPASRLAMIYNAARYAPNCIAGGDITGAGITEKAIIHLKALSDLSAKSGTTYINLWVRGEQIQIGQNISKVVQQETEADYHDIGTLQGRLEAIQDASGTLRIRVKDFLYARAINCKVPERLIGLVMNGFRRRVEIEGRIHFRHDGTPISIEAESIELLPEDDELPTATQVRGLLASA